MFRIGDFSRIARVSARLLRFYDEIGLLTPAHADSRTGYRYYDADQLVQLNRIVVLKELGFNLEQIDAVMKRRVSAAELRGMLLLRRNDAERAIALESQRLRQLETRIAQIETEGCLSSEDVVIRVEPARRVLSMRRLVPSFAAARAVITELREHSRPLRPAEGWGQLVAIAHSPDFEPDDIDVELGFTLSAGTAIDIPPGSPLAVRELPNVDRMAVCVRVGLPEDAHLVTAKIGRFLHASGDTLAGPGREVFLQPPNLERMHEAVVEMQFPVEAVRPV
jgi:DNA-binding transcriptional MerR regulator